MGSLLQWSFTHSEKWCQETVKLVLEHWGGTTPPEDIYVYLMATKGCSPTTFLCTCDNAFYFQVRLTDGPYEEDTFQKSHHVNHFIRSNDNKFMFLSDEGQFQAQNLTIHQQTQSDFKFGIQIYKEFNNVRRKGKPVMLYANKDGKKLVACCNENNEIYPEAMDLPSQIDETAYKGLFFLKQVTKQSNKYMFESSLYPNKFLRFEPTVVDPSLDKLVLRDKDEDEVDERCEVSF